jgi:hypothetical protein
MGLGRQLQAPQLGKSDTFGPGQHGASAAAAQRLFAGPQRLVFIARSHQQHTLELQAVGLQRGGVGYPGRVHQHHPLPLFAQFRQYREQQAEFTQAGPAAEQFGNRAQRPAPAGQPRIQPRMPGGKGGLALAALAALPQPWRGVQQLIDDGFAAHRCALS